MYFQELDKLKESNSNISDFDKYDNLLFQIFINNYSKRFNYKVYKYFFEDIDEDEWLCFLNILSKNDLIFNNYEICCPNCDETIETYVAFDDILFEEIIECKICLEEYELTNNDIFITFSFNDDFKPDETKENKNFNHKPKIEEKPSLEELMNHPEFIIETIIDGRREELKSLLVSIKEDNDGKKLENLAKVLFNIPPYMELHDTNTRTSTGEIDVLFLSSKVNGTIFQNCNDLIIIECKNWGKKVGAPEVRVLSDKMNDIRSNLGIILSKKGITGDDNHIRAAKGIIRRKWDQDSKVILDFSYNDMEDIILNSKNLYKSLKTKYYNVHTV